MPKELLCIAPRKLELREYSEPPLQPEQVRIRNEFGAAKHGTEMALYKGICDERGGIDPEYQVFTKGKTMMPFPFAVGNMNVGTVTEVGAQVTKLAVGEKALAYGGFRETMTVAESACFKMPQGLSWKAAVCFDPLRFALLAVRDGHVRVGDAIAVFGLGAIGLVAVQVAKMSGASPVIAVDPLPNRRHAAEVCGADLVLDPTKCDAGLEIKKATGKRGVDVAIEYSGSHHALQAAIRGVAYGGNVVAGAWPAPYGAGLDLGAEAHWNVPNLIFSRECSYPNRDHPRWNKERNFAACWQLITSGKINAEPIVQPVVSFAEILKEFPKIESDPVSNIKLGVSF